MPTSLATGSRGPATPRRRTQRGASAVEFSLVMLPLFYLIFGIIQYGWYFYVAETTSGAAGSVTRRLAVGDCWASGEALAHARSQAPRVSAVTTSPPTLAGASTTVTVIDVTLTADANILDVYPMPHGGIVTKTARARLEDTTAGSPCA